MQERSSIHKADHPITAHDLGIGPAFFVVRDAMVVGHVETNRIVLWNPAAERVFGYTAEQAIGQPLELIAAERYKALHRAGIQRYAAGQGGHLIGRGVFEFPGLHRSGRELTVEFSLAPLESPDRGGTYVMALIRDVSERKHYEQELEAHARRLADQQAFIERVIESVPAGIAILDLNFVFRRVNPAYARGLGTTPEQLIGKSVYDVFGDTERPNPRLQAVVDTGQPLTITGMPLTVTQDGRAQTTYWDATYIPMFAADGGIDGVLALAQEVSQRLENERLQRERIDALIEADRYKDQFISVVSHELRTPLNFITGFASILADEVYGELSGSQHEAVDNILNGADRMLVLVDDLLDYAKLHAGRFELSRDRVSYRKLIEEVLTLMQPIADQKGIALHCDAPAVDGWCLDGARITQVLTNLVSNALKFTDVGGQIVVAARVVGDRLHTEVRDSGCGIAEADIPRLFQHFQQLDMSNTRRAGGTGLGLAISKAIVEAHGGAIGVTSELGSGSTFWFDLPRLDG